GEEDPAAENLAHLDEPEPELEEFDVAAYDAAIVVQGDPAERAETFLVNLLLNIDPGYAVEIDAVTDEEVFVEVYGGDPGKIIGRAGRTLAALEYVTNAVVNREGERPTRVNIDVGGYKRRRDARLRDTALAAAARVRKNGVAVKPAWRAGCSPTGSAAPARSARRSRTGSGGWPRPASTARTWTPRGCSATSSASRAPNCSYAAAKPSRPRRRPRSTRSWRGV